MDTGPVSGATRKVRFHFRKAGGARRPPHERGVKIRGCHSNETLHIYMFMFVFAKRT